MSIRIFILDEHRSAMEILALRLSALPDMEVVGSASDSEEGLRRIQELHPDVVLLDTKMKGGNGLDVCRRVCSTQGAAKVAVLTSYTDPDERRMAYQAGVCGYLLKEVDTPNLARWIRLLMESDRQEPGEGNPTGRRKSRKR